MDTYLVSYYHKGERWGQEIKAENLEDARARLVALRWGHIDGQKIVALPASLGWFGRLVVSMRNAFSGPGQ